MSLRHFEIHRLERRIAEVLEKGFLRPPSPDGKGFDKADCLQAGHDVADMLLTEYAMEEKDALLEEMGTPPPMREAVKDLRRLLSEPLNGLGGLFQNTPPFPAIKAAGLGGGNEGAE